MYREVRIWPEFKPLRAKTNEIARSRWAAVADEDWHYVDLGENWALIHMFSAETILIWIYIKEDD